MNIRRYRPGEEEEIWRLYRDTTRIVNGPDYTPEQIRRWAPDHMSESWPEQVGRMNPFVAEHDGGIVGFAELEADGHIDRFYCHHRWQRRGVGRKLYQAVEAEALRLNLDRLHAEVSVTARAFFERMGFEVIAEQSKIICGAVARNFRMQKRLAPAADAK